MKILEKSVLSDSFQIRVIQIKVEAPAIAHKAKAGQFVVFMACEEGERVPLTVVGSDPDSGTIILIFQEAGLSTKLLGKLKVGDSVYALVGPLGHATRIKNYGKIILIGGGVGIAEIYPVAKALKQAGNHITTILGARSKDLLILEKELKDISDQLHVATDDGSYGTKGFVTDIFKSLKLKAYSLIYAVGPIPMMEAVSDVSGFSGVKTMVSLNALMVDGTGMCGCCRVTVEGKTKFTCIDGPEFDAQAVDWQELSQRTGVYQDKEAHICKLHNLL